MIKLLYGTGNPSKLNAMRTRLSAFDVKIIGLKDLTLPIPEVNEDGETPLENAQKKAKAYYEAFGMPVFSCDSGLYIDELPEALQPKTHVRRVNGKNLTDEEMTAYYASLAKKYGRLTARYKNAICFIKDSEHIYSAMEKSMESSVFYMVDKPHSRFEKGFPLDRISVDPASGQYFYDKSAETLNQLAVEDGFLEFFKKYL